MKYMDIRPNLRPPIVPPYPDCMSGYEFGDMRGTDISQTRLRLSVIEDEGLSLLPRVSFENEAGHAVVVSGRPDQHMSDHPERFKAIHEVAQLTEHDSAVRGLVQRKFCGRVSMCTGTVTMLDGKKQCGALNDIAVEEILAETAEELGLL